MHNSPEQDHWKSIGEVLNTILVEIKNLTEEVRKGRESVTLQGVTCNVTSVTESKEERQKRLTNERVKRHRAKAKKSVTCNVTSVTSVNLVSSNGFPHPSLTPSPPNPKEKPPLKGGQKERASPPKGTRFQPQSNIPAQWADEAKRISGHDLAAAQKTYEKFSDYWIAKAGKDACKLDWLATWRNWCRQEWNISKPTAQKQTFSVGYISPQAETTKVQTGILTREEIGICLEKGFPSEVYAELKQKRIPDEVHNFMSHLAIEALENWRVQNG